MIVFTLVSVIWYVPIEKLINGNYFTGSGDLKIHFIDVGHGDAIIVDLPDGKNVLIDSGPECDNLDNYINHIFKDDIVFDYFILTHIDGDHIGNALDVLKKYKVNTLYRPSILSSGETGEGLAVSKNEKYNKLIDFATANNINMCYNRSGEVILGDNYRFDFLSPEKIYYEKDNDYSPIIKLTYNDKKILFTGDAEDLAETEVSQKEISADILKLAHHGSGTSSSYEFLTKVNPKYVVVSCEAGVYNDVPSQTVLNRLEMLGVKHENIFRTDVLNSIVINIDEDINILTNDSADKNFIHYYYIIIVVSVLLYACVFESTLGQKR